MADDEDSNARIIAEAMSEVFNALCHVVDPDRFGTVSPDDLASLRACLRELIRRAPKFRGRAPAICARRAVGGRFRGRFFARFCGCIGTSAVQ